MPLSHYIFKPSQTLAAISLLPLIVAKGLCKRGGVASYSGVFRALRHRGYRRRLDRNDAGVQHVWGRGRRTRETMQPPEDFLKPSRSSFWSGQALSFEFLRSSNTHANDFGNLQNDSIANISETIECFYGYELSAPKSHNRNR